MIQLSEFGLEFRSVSAVKELPKMLDFAREMSEE